MTFTLLRPSGEKWTVGDYLKRICKTQDIEAWKRENGNNWKFALEKYLHEQICNVLPRLYLEIKE